MIHYRFDEARRDFGIDCIAADTKSAHAAGMPWSQRECSSVNGPPAWTSGVSAIEPVRISPETVNWPRSAVTCAAAPGNRSVPCDGPPFGPSCAQGVGQPDRCAADPNGSAGPRYTPVDTDNLALRANTVSGGWSGSIAHGVGHPDNAAICVSGMPVSCGRESFDPRRPSTAVGVAQPVSQTTRPSKPLIGTFGQSDPSFQTLAVGVGHPESAATHVRRTEARRRKRDTPEGVTQGFQVSLYKVEPRIRTLVCNLLASDALRAALVDKPICGGPKVPLVIKPSSFACRAERLAWAGTGPDRALVGPAGAAQGVGPDSSSGEEVDLSISSKLIWSNVTDIPFVHDAWSDHAGLDGLADCLRGERINLVVIGAPAPRLIEARRAKTGTGLVHESRFRAAAPFPSGAHTPFLASLVGCLRMDSLASATDAVSAAMREALI